MSARPTPLDPARERIAAAAVRMIGADGYAGTSVDDVCERARAGRRHFDRCFADLEDCLLTVHDELTEELCERVTLATAGPQSWHDRIWAAGWAAMGFLREDPVRARFLIAGVNGAGSRARGRRDRLVQRCADLLDGGRDELGDSRPASRCSAEVAAGAIYSLLLAKLEAGWIDRREEFLPELIYVAVMPYLGARAAEEELLVQPLR